MNLWPIALGTLGAGAGLAAWGAMSPSSQLFGPTVRLTGRPSTVALTFDDGPNPEITPRLLDLFDKHGIHATFFLVGRFVRACPQLAADIVARGHVVGNHTETHPNLFRLSTARVREEITACQQAIEQAAARKAVWMRPPFGFRGPNLIGVLREQGLRGMVMWSKILWDWKPQPAERLIHRLRRVRGGDIVVLHDGDYRALGGDRHHVVAALEHWLPRWKDVGLEFVTLDDVGG